MASFKAYTTSLMTSAKIGGKYCKPGEKVKITSLKLQEDLERCRSIRGRNDSKEIAVVNIGDENSEAAREEKREN